MMASSGDAVMRVGVQEVRGGCKTCGACLGASVGGWTRGPDPLAFLHDMAASMSMLHSASRGTHRGDGS